jgi:hypothetical protein
LEYLPQRNQKKESQIAKKNELPITAKGEEGKTEGGQRQGEKEGRMARLTGKMQMLCYNTKHTHALTHVFRISSSLSPSLPPSLLLSLSLSLSLFILSLYHMCVIERGPYQSCLMKMPLERKPGYFD